MPRIGIDIGGTFTDFVCYDERSGEFTVEKLLTTSASPADAVLHGLRSLAGHGLRSATVVHGTTLVANAIIERKGARVGFITTKGFRDIPAMGTERRYDVYDLFLRLPEPLVGRECRIGVRERINAQGKVLEPLDVSDLDQAARGLVNRGAQSLAVAFLHAYVNPEHEVLAARYLRATFPTVDISVSHEVAPEIGEYARFTTTIANAYVQPLIRSYLRDLRARIRDVIPDAQVYVAFSSGSLARLELAEAVPVRLVESGPVAGVLGTHAIVRPHASGPTIAFDMGGTTAKIAVIGTDGPQFANAIEVDRLHRFKPGSGIPLRVPSVDLLEIGAGGGSIARVDRSGLLKVGPDSQGADPGPACYARGGTLPTVTDADLILGYLNPDNFLGGRMPLSQERASRAIASLSDRLGVSVEDVAIGIHEVVNNAMASAIRVNLARANVDPRKCTLVAFGGAGPVHAYELARLLGIRGVVIPAAAGVLSALGLATLPPAMDFGQTYVARLDELDLAEVRRLVERLAERATDELACTGVPRGRIRLTLHAEMRYARQAESISVRLPASPSAWAAEGLRQAFTETYVKVYGRSLGGHEVETVSWLARAESPPVAASPRLAEAPARAVNPLKGTRWIRLPGSVGPVEARVFDRYAMRRGESITGPAIVEERESTTVIGSQGAAAIDQRGHVVVDVRQ